MMTLRECARMETTMCKGAVNNNVCVQESVLQETTKKTPTRRLRRKTQCVERRPERCAENARDRNRKCSQCLEEATRTKSESKLELVNTEGLRHTENETHMHTCRYRQPAPEKHDQMYQT